jgi:hypothetical protein
LIPRTVPFGYIGRVTKMWIALSILAVAAALILAGCQATRAGYESAPYQVVRASGQFAVRDYPALQVVETPLARAGNDADGSFKRLFRFITGANEAKQKIAMSPPVYGYFDPPWTPGFLRRNEVMLRTEGEKQPIA